MSDLKVRHLCEATGRPESRPVLHTLTLYQRTGLRTRCSSQRFASRLFGVEAGAPVASAKKEDGIGIDDRRGHNCQCAECDIDV